jgi:hypothetical protein
VPVRAGESLTDRFPIRDGLKQGDAVSSLLFNCALEYAIMRVQVIQDGLKLNGTHQILVYADDVNTLEESVPVACRGVVWGVQTLPPPRNSEVLPKLSRIPSSVEYTSVTT